MNPLQQISTAFEQNRPALMPYFPLGYPDLPSSLDIIAACVAGGADLMELGMPFSDPLADGPTIQHSTQVALENGMTTEKCLSAAAALREQGIRIPFMLMGYYNPILAYGERAFVEAARQAGVNGLIIPDLPPQEAGPIESLCRDEGLALTYLLSPNSTDERIKLVCERSTGFTYLVSVTGITGARQSLSNDLAGFIQRVRKYARNPLAVGFGISTPEQAAAVGKEADGVIVGSALVRHVGEAKEKGEDAARAAEGFVRGLHNALA